ncbi:hypothetical protein AXG93_4182s1280 [Marchantia polymorpha subsp. ruderalis]|uniref:Protein kinase domain-containing protein n=1 Tax=Marchantia polymorpha subsp. ruderalis TaxID=1480154 RepID=A0A176VEC8_MARPO|nr:hypothetical protein AXG93_4182s1280 [Marchantia polymorpha subsp. ruderalis]
MSPAATPPPGGKPRAESAPAQYNHPQHPPAASALSRSASAPVQPRHKVWLERPKFPDFKLGPCLGTGSFGRVHLAHYQPQVIHVKQEKGILQKIDYPFIVNLFGCCQDDKCVHLVLEYVCGGEFFTYLRSTGRFDEQTTVDKTVSARMRSYLETESQPFLVYDYGLGGRFYAAQVLLSFEYLHGMDIIYRDLKPENLLLDNKGNIKIADFGFAKQIDRRTYTLCGTPDYLAPEIILNKGHGKPVDWWAYGVLIFEMLAGYPPFYDDDALGTYQKILSGRLNFPGHFSRSAKDLIRRLLVADLTKRIGCLKNGVEEIKTHAWFSSTNWDNVYNKKDAPPIRPKVSADDDATCFDDYSKLEPMKHEFVLTPDDQKVFEDL